MPNDFDGVTALFSPGVSDNWSFEEDLSTRYGVPAFLCDRHVQVSRCPFPVDDFWIGPATAGDLVTLEHWVDMRDPDQHGDLVLQMDIEDAEYLALLTCSRQTLNRFRILIVELHGLHRLLQQDWLRSIGLPTLEKLAELFEVVHLHPNNAAPVDTRMGIEIPVTVEVTYHRKDRVTRGSGNANLPHLLDRPNVPTKEDIRLSEYWAPRSPAY